MSDGLFERLDRIEKLLIELVELARKNWDLDNDEPPKQTRRLERQRKHEPAPDLGDVWEVVHKGDPYEGHYAQDDKDPYEGMYDEGGEDVNERFYETDETEKAEVKKGEIKAEQVPQKGKAAKGKSRKRSGAPDYG